MDAVDKHEYYRGEVFAMSGGTPTQSLINANGIGALVRALRGGPCRVYDNNLRIRIPRTTLYTYPDASVICGELQYDPRDKSRQTVLNPTVLVEVLSPSTEAYDRGAKFASYLQIESLKEYILIAQDTPRIETFLRQSDGAWRYLPAAGVETIARLESVEVQLPLAEVYEGVTFPEPAPPTEAIV